MPVLRNHRGGHPGRGSSVRGPTTSGATSHRPPASYVDGAVRDALLSPKVRLTGETLLCAFHGSQLCCNCRQASQLADPYIARAVLRFDAEVEQFVNNPEQKEMSFSENLSSYQVAPGPLLALSRLSAAYCLSSPSLPVSYPHGLPTV